MLAPMKRLAFCTIAGIALLSASSARAADDKFAHDPLIVAIGEKAPEVVKYLDKMNLTNVGVLKFLVQRPGEKLSDNAGELNRNMADYMEVALVQAAPERVMGQTERLRIIKKASEKIAKQNNPEFTHKTEDGRKLFFDLTYDLFWGREKVKADAFITGTVIFDKEQKAHIQFQIFDKTGKMSNLLDEIKMTPTLKMLTNAGYSLALAEEMLKKPDVVNIVGGASFSVPTVNNANKPDLLITSPDVKLAGDPYRSPVRVTVRYKSADGRTTDQAIVDGAIREPNEKEKVSILIENPTEYTFAVLVRINGLNTIFPEKVCHDPRLCHKWILKPGQKEVIEGFQTNDKKYTAFRVLSPAESKKDEVNYGNDVGTIQIISFKGEIVNKDPDEALTLKQDDNDRRKIAITRGSLTFGEGAPPATLKELQAHLKDTGKLFSGAPRGLIGKDPDGEGTKEIERFYFRSDVEAQNATIRYYKPESKER